MLTHPAATTELPQLNPPDINTPDQSAHPSIVRSWLPRLCLTGLWQADWIHTFTRGGGEPVGESVVREFVAWRV
jgi:hypothetical protein